MTRNETIKLLRISIFLAIILIIASYALFRSMDYIKGPEIIVDNPKNGETVREPSTKVRGYALRISDIWLNNRPITLSEDGYFEETVLLNPGYNNITLHVKDRFGREENSFLEIIRKDF